MSAITHQIAPAIRREKVFCVSQDPDDATVVLTRCRKLYIRSRRIHHGLTGEAIFAIGLLLHRRLISAVGLALMAHDRADFPFPLKDPVGWGPKQLKEEVTK